MTPVDESPSRPVRVCRVVWLGRSLWDFRPAFFPPLFLPRADSTHPPRGRRSSTPSVTIQFVHLGPCAHFWWWCSPMETVQRVGCERKNTDLARRDGGVAGGVWRLSSVHSLPSPFLRPMCHRVSEDRLWWCGGLIHTAGSRDELHKGEQSTHITVVRQQNKMISADPRGKQEERTDGSERQSN